jgi:hypothetical protein
VDNVDPVRQKNDSRDAPEPVSIAVGLSLRRYCQLDSAAHLTLDRPKPQSGAGCGASKARSGRHLKLNPGRLLDKDVSQQLAPPALFVREFAILRGLGDFTGERYRPLHHIACGMVPNFSG